MGPIQEVSWTKIVFPELLWLALLHDQFGHKKAVELATQMARAVRVATNSNRAEEAPETTCAAISDFASLTASQASDAKERLGEHYALIAIVLKQLTSWYPECPLNVLFDVEASSASSDSLRRIKNVVEALYERTEPGPIMVQATAVWLAFDAGKLIVNEGLALAKFSEIEKYPDTELSRKVGSGVRAVTNALFRSHTGEWPRYFWNRGLEIELCEFSYER